jgi:hypothetical protein
MMIIKYYNSDHHCKKTEMAYDFTRAIDDIIIVEESIRKTGSYGNVKYSYANLYKIEIKHAELVQFLGSYNFTTE